MGISRIDLDLDMGEFVAITGESGSGKSTLLNVISGLDTYEEGEMIVCGEDTTAYSTEEYETYRKTYIGNIFQDFNLINSYTVYENIELVMLLSGKSRDESLKRVDKLIDLVGLSQYRNTKASKLSGGQKQRVAIARAIAKDAPIIVADEPTGNLDSASAEAVMETLAKVAGNKLVVIVTHNYEQAEPYATRKLTMRDGKIVEDRKTGEAGNKETLSIEQLYESLAKEAHLQENQDQENQKQEYQEQEDQAAEETVPVPKMMTKSSELRLGTRNTFNLPAKFILLFIVYFFVSTAVLGQYASEKNSIHESDLLGTNPYFVNTSANRIVVKKANGAVFTDKDYETIKALPNVKDVVKNDVALDKGVSACMGELAIEGPLVSFDQIPEGKLAFGHMPRNDREIVIRLDSTNDAYITMAGSGQEYIGDPVVFMDINQNQVYDINEEITLAGIILDDINAAKNEDYSIYGYSTIYASESVSDMVMASMMASVSRTGLDYGGTILNVDYGRAVYVSPNVPDGKAFILEDEAFFYVAGEDDEKTEGAAEAEPAEDTEAEDAADEETAEDTEDEQAADEETAEDAEAGQAADEETAEEKDPAENADEKTLGISIHNHFFSSEGKYTVDRIITKDNCKKLLGMSGEEYEKTYNCVFISFDDFMKLFNRGRYQISVFMADEQESEDLQQALEENGYTTLMIKNALADSDGDLGKVLDLVTYGRLALEFIVLFFIAYAVIRLIMRSRNSYYSTLRMLGASAGNTRSILRTELTLMMLIAYSVVVAIAALINTGRLQALTGYQMTELTKLLKFLEWPDYTILGILLLLMSLLIANRYSRRIFKMSAMKTFREGV